MKGNKFTIDFGNLKLTDRQYKALLAAVHTTVNAKLKKVKVIGTAKPKPSVKSFAITAVVAVATISAVFTGTDPGLSELKAKHKGVTKILTHSGSLTFDNVNKNDIISIQGKSLGSSDISIDVKASPQQKKFNPGTFNFNFFIL